MGKTVRSYMFKNNYGTGRKNQNEERFGKDKKEVRKERYSWKKEVKNQY
jgi:hypothetical protein